jgi:hypothetical protein
MSLENLFRSTLSVRVLSSLASRRVVNPGVSLRTGSPGLPRQGFHLASAHAHTAFIN